MRTGYKHIMSFFFKETPSDYTHYQIREIENGNMSIDIMKDEEILKSRNSYKVAPRTFEYFDSERIFKFIKRFPVVLNSSTPTQDEKNPFANIYVFEGIYRKNNDISNKIVLKLKSVTFDKIPFSLIGKVGRFLFDRKLSFKQECYEKTKNSKIIEKAIEFADNVVIDARNGIKISDDNICLISEEFDITDIFGIIGDETLFFDDNGFFIILSSNIKVFLPDIKFSQDLDDLAFKFVKLVKTKIGPIIDKTHFKFSEEIKQRFVGNVFYHFPEGKLSDELFRDVGKRFRLNRPLKKFCRVRVISCDENSLDVEEIY